MMFISKPIRLYDILFEQDTASTSTTSDPTKVADTIKGVLEPFVKDQKEANEKITSYLDKLNKKDKSPAPSNPALTATKGTKGTVPSTPAGMNGSSAKPASSPQEQNKLDTLTKDVETIKDLIQKKD